MTTIIYCEKCDRIIDLFGEDDDQYQDATELCVTCEENQGAESEDE